MTNSNRPATPKQTEGVNDDDLSQSDLSQAIPLDTVPPPPTQAIPLDTVPPPPPPERERMPDASAQFNAYKDNPISAPNVALPHGADFVANSDQGPKFYKIMQGFSVDGWTGEWGQKFRKEYPGLINKIDFHVSDDWSSMGYYLTIGQGNFGTVRLAREISQTGEPGEYVVVKEVRGEDSALEGRREFLFQNLFLKSESKLDNNFVPIVAAQETGNAIYQFLKIADLGDGNNLIDSLHEQPALLQQSERNGYFKINSVDDKEYPKKWHDSLFFHIMREMLKSVGHLHERGLLHNDLKPNNFLCGTDYSIRLSDFGAGAAWETVENQFKETAQVGGRSDRGYWPPEFFKVLSPSSEISEDRLSFRDKEKRSLYIDMFKKESWSLGITLLQYYFGVKRELKNDTVEIDVLHPAGKKLCEYFYETSAGIPIKYSHLDELINLIPESAIKKIIQGLLKPAAERLSVPEALQHFEEALKRSNIEETDIINGIKPIYEKIKHDKADSHNIKLLGARLARMPDIEAKMPQLEAHRKPHSVIVNVAKDTDSAGNSIDSIKRFALINSFSKEELSDFEKEAPHLHKRFASKINLKRNGRYGLQLARGDQGVIKLARELKPDGNPGKYCVVKKIKNDVNAIKAARAEYWLHQKYLNRDPNLRDAFVNLHASAEIKNRRKEAVVYQFMDLAEGDGNKLVEDLFVKSPNEHSVLKTTPRGNKVRVYKLPKTVDFTTQMQRISTVMLHHLSVMHEHGIFHRDIKPNNFLVFSDGSIKLSDFAAAYVAQKNFDVSRNSDRSYQPPEVLTPKVLNLDKPTLFGNDKLDSWALGITLLQLYYGVTRELKSELTGNNVPKKTVSIEVLHNGGEELADYLLSITEKRPIPYGILKKLIDKMAIESPENKVLSDVIAGLLIINPLQRLSVIDAANLLNPRIPEKQNITANDVAPLASNIADSTGTFEEIELTTFVSDNVPQQKPLQHDLPSDYQRHPKDTSQSVKAPTAYTDIPKQKVDPEEVSSPSIELNEFSSTKPHLEANYNPNYATQPEPTAEVKLTDTVNPVKPSTVLSRFRTLVEPIRQFLSPQSGQQNEKQKTRVSLTMHMTKFLSKKKKAPKAAPVNDHLMAEENEPTPMTMETELETIAEQTPKAEVLNTETVSVNDNITAKENEAETIEMAIEPETIAEDQTPIAQELNTETEYQFSGSISAPLTPTFDEVNTHKQSIEEPSPEMTHDQDPIPLQELSPEEINESLAAINQFALALPAQTDTVDLKLLNDIYQLKKTYDDKPEFKDTISDQAIENLKAAMAEKVKDGKFIYQVALNMWPFKLLKKSTSIERKRFDDAQRVIFKFNFDRKKHGSRFRMTKHDYAEWAKDQIEALLAAYLKEKGTTKEKFEVLVSGGFTPLMVKALVTYCKSVNIVCQNAVNSFVPKAKNVAKLERRLAENQQKRDKQKLAQPVLMSVVDSKKMTVAEVKSAVNMLLPAANKLNTQMAKRNIVFRLFKAIKPRQKQHQRTETVNPSRENNHHH